MKKNLVLTLFIMCIWLKAQETPKYVYGEIVGTSKFLSKKVLVEIDYGQATSFWESNRMKNPDGSNKEFNSMVDAMNYMGALGWEFQQAYVVTIGQQNVYHWLMRKEFNDLDSNIKEEMKKNFPTKRDLK
ncbi:hypothetical protein ASG22_04055 [Chryseobacterium sp. Leaf405]|uniref:hypothetical protein n=1 Tax=Chryseobacterium sp. Leaf405 TaxID=1736367 RepID=UPI0006FF9F39|nr:hypothetical protein [Chryseobacterium sp. Leaf405]KQT25882.1 hypothetical protein ASG22_04055 [Chryseobacterium sp. Leaf405]